MYAQDNGGGDFEQPPIGTHVARCVRLIDIGTHKSEYQGQVNIKHQIIVGWELPDELMTTGEHAGKPFMVSKFYTLSLSEKANLRADLKNWRTRDFTEEELKRFDMRNILGKPCMLSLTNTEKGKIKVSGVMSLPKSSACPNQVNENLFLSLEPDLFDQTVFDGLSDGYKKLITASPEYRQLTTPNYSPPQQGMDDFDDDIPF